MARITYRPDEKKMFKQTYITSHSSVKVRVFVLYSKIMPDEENLTRNYSSFYYNEEICREEKEVTAVYVAVLSIMGAFATYFLISLIVALNRSPPPKGKSDGSVCKLDFATILRGLLLAVISTIVARTALDIVQLRLGRTGYDFFGAIFITKAVLSTLTNACVYGFLWLRQWLLYNQPILREVKTTTFKVFNIFVLILIISLVAVGPAIEVRYVILELTEDGCMLAGAKKWGYALAILTFFSIAYEAILLGYFIYPLKRTHSHQGSEDKSAVLPIVKRSLMSAIACFINEIVFTAVHNLIERPLMLNTVTADLKHIVYYVSLVASYNDWVQKFCLPCAARSIRTPAGSKVGTETKSRLSTTQE